MCSVRGYTMNFPESWQAWNILVFTRAPDFRPFCKLGEERKSLVRGFREKRVRLWCFLSALLFSRERLAAPSHPSVPPPFGVLATGAV